MLLGCIADDFTGAGDIANTLSVGGMQTRLFVGVPNALYSDCALGAEAGVIALKTRSASAGAAVEESLRALAWLRERGCRQFVFKYCSTFDSTPQGNIGPVATALADALGVSGVVVCPAFPANGRTVYQGHLFVRDRLLSESGMEQHPLTPMTDPDIRRWLARQCARPIGHVTHQQVGAGPGALRAALEAHGRAGDLLVVVDAINDDDLRIIGEAQAASSLLTGSSGVALGLPENFRRAGSLSGKGALHVPVSGRALILAGSCSTNTRAQVRRYAGSHPSFAIDTAALMRGEKISAAAIEFIDRHASQAPLIYSSAEPHQVNAAQKRFGSENVSEATERLFGDLARSGVAAGVRRLVVAGGETSGAVVSALGLRSLAIGAEIAPGVPALFGDVGGIPLALALKSGNFGDADFFATALSILGDECD